jgi:predicted RNase H-like HicB family nuclease
VSGDKTDYGKRLNELWKVGAKHALYHKDGTFYEVLERFPGVLFDNGGGVLFQNVEDFKNCSYLSIGEKVNVRGGISKIPGYKPFYRLGTTPTRHETLGGRRYVIIIKQSGGSFSAYSPDLPGCAATGTTVKETVERMSRAMKTHIAELAAEHSPVPEPRTLAEYICIS